ncbi:hypothetical protein I204_08384 [Kwoniella mangroviensis CBS 8886]|uniref:uncharacterized protein n=1 Tax=Kwoniella mangroviensis CBS 8507 TaxID=1296122 RepID=UPI00080CFC21|nr:uncharacterized protein I203_01459 [Kwoniella mangroviensis CBS 8507]OCF69595.1 hypothetical protein I203_01459 [Kwoniella mangroviensis CBS 8507]OCF70949.1 hypothetical protein I204_08384 [Kwoniella mangroviensis CBS 8886]
MLSASIRSRGASSTLRYIFQTRSQSTSDTPSPAPTRPSYSKANLASFAAEGELLTTAHKPSPRISPATSQAQSSSAHSKPLAFPRPVLKSNPYANKYTVSEADLDAFEEPLRLSPTPSPLESQSSSSTVVTASTITASDHEPAAGPRKGGRIVRTIRRPKYKSKSIRVFTDPELVYQPLELGHEETVELQDGYIIYKNQDVPPAVITWGRLRDACTCKLCRDPSTSQKTFTTGQAMREAYPSGTDVKPLIEVVDMARINGKNSKKGLKITWNPTTSSGEPHTTYLSRFKLRLLTDPQIYKEAFHPPLLFDRKLWNSEEILKTDGLRVPFREVETKDPAILLRMLEQLHQYGLTIVENVPTSPMDDKDCYLRKVMGYIGEIRNTFYGETWNVKSMNQSKNVAYTNLDLGLHMDLLYFSSPPRFQALHCLRNRVNGGTSYFVDSFKVAQDLPDDVFRLLQHTRIPYVYDNDNHLLRYSHAVMSSSSPEKNRMVYDKHYAINWSPPFRDMTGPDLSRPAPRTPALRAKQEQQTLEAIAKFENALSDPQYKFEFLLKEGDLVIFDNRRILHARTSFSDKSPEELKQAGMELVEGEPTRWLKGCYLDGEVVWDKLAVLKKQVAEMEKKQDRNEAKR